MADIIKGIFAESIQEIDNMTIDLDALAQCWADALNHMECCND